MFSQKHINFIKNGKIGVIPTDTLYGLVVSVKNTEAVNRLKEVKGIKKERKGFVILAGNINDVAKHTKDISSKEKTILEKLWPGPFSIILEVNDELAHITGYNENSFRIPADRKLRDFLKETGPLLAPSANPTNLEPASNIDIAKEYFGDLVDFYVDGGGENSNPSTVLSIKEGVIDIKRQGVGRVDEMIVDLGR